MQETTQLNTLTNIVFVLTDVLETNLLEMQQQYKKEGFELRHDSKRNFNTAIAAIKRLKSDVNHCSESTQENFGNDSDMVNAMLLTLIDRCGDDEFPPSIFYEFEGNKDDGFDTPREAFAALIDKVSGKGTWESNPYVFVYEFELID